MITGSKIQIGNKKTYDTLERSLFIEEQKHWLQKLLACDFKNTFFSKLTSGYSHQHWLSFSSFSHTRDQLARSPDLLRQEVNKCENSRLRVIKTIRVTNLENIWPVLDGSTKIIHLLRDPRAVQNSRLKLNTHLGPRLICDWPIRTIQFSQKQELSARGTYTELVFENFAKDPVSSFRDIYKFLGMEMTSDMESLIRNLTQSGNRVQGGFSARERNATMVANNWEKTLDEENRKWIEDDPTCQQLLQHLQTKS